ncbi:MAG: hypothetical protein FJX80_11975 [Bacteroidetes bacterium]|nr:hypothetical protein [Bacteroidota bacterium]
MVTIKPEDKEEFIKYFLQTVELTQKISPHISHLRDSGDKEGYSKRFREHCPILHSKTSESVVLLTLKSEEKEKEPTDIAARKINK